jgi:pyruvate formate lyase activating enzyme
MNTGTIFDIKRFAIYDGPGVRTTVFLKGCPLSCWACHNPEGQLAKPDLFVRSERCNLCRDCLEICRLGAISLDGGELVVSREKCDSCGSCAEVCLPGALEVAGREVTVAEVMEEIEKDVLYYDESGGGATFSGGEPLSQPEFLQTLLGECRKSSISTAVDTSGHFPSCLVETVQPLVDLFLYDLKLIDEGRHWSFTGMSNGPVIENLRLLAQLDAAVIIRFPLLSGVNDDSDNVEQLGQLLASLPVSYPVDILPYHRIGRDKYSRLGRTYRMGDTEPPSEDKVAVAAQALAGFGIDVSVKGEAYANQ